MSGSPFDKTTIVSDLCSYCYNGFTFHIFKMTRIVGLMGGMSWQTTALYYKEINQHVCAKLGGLHSANLLLRSLDYATIAKMVSSKDFDGMTELVCKSGLELKAAGAQALALCANVAHKTADALESRTGLPVLHIVDFTGQKIVDSKLTKVGLLATRAVMEEEFYKARLREKFGLDVLVPQDEKFRANADHEIFDEMSKEVIPQDVRASWRTAAMDLVQNQKVEAIILGCTELRLVFGVGELNVPTFETTVLHARGIADWALSEDDSNP